MQKKLLEGKIISLPIDASHIELCDKKGNVITNESKLPLVYNHEKGVFRIIGWTSKMGKIVSLKNIDTGEELTHAPVSELKRLVFEYFDTKIGNYKQLPIIAEVDYSFSFRQNNTIDNPEQNKIKCYEMFYEIDNTDEARKENDSVESTLLSSTKAVYYAKLQYTPDEQWDIAIAEANKYVSSVRPVTAHQEREKEFWDYFKSNYHIHKTVQ